MESSKIHARALLVKECCKEPSNWQSVMSLPAFLNKFDIAGVEHLDTRALTRHIRINGAMRGRISTRDRDPESLRKKVLEQPTMVGQNLARYVACKDPYTWADNAPLLVHLEEDGSYAWQGRGIPLLVFDFGTKWNILRHLCNVGFEPLCVPPTLSAEEVRKTGAHGLFLSNGPGDPAPLKDAVQVVKELIYDGMPVTGICLGHQIIGQALGGKIVKLKFGHHGCNHPVRDLSTGKVEISSQNHGFAVCLDGVDNVEVTHINLNDQTIEGLRHTKLPVMSMQYHPEAAAGPHDSAYLFGRFKKILES